MKTTTLLAAALATSSVATFAGGVVFKTPVTYTEPVTYAAGVTYLAPVTYSAAATTLEPVMLERVVVTPSRVYAEHEWKARLSARRAAAQFWPVKAAPHRFEHSNRNWLRSLIAFK